MYNYGKIYKGRRLLRCVYVLSIIKTFDSCVHYCYWGKSLLFCFILTYFSFFFHFVFLLINSSIPPRARTRRGERTKEKPTPPWRVSSTRSMSRNIVKGPWDEIAFHRTKGSNDKIDRKKKGVLFLNGPMLCNSDASRFRAFSFVRSFSHSDALSLGLSLSFPARRSFEYIYHSRPVICLSPLIRKKKKETEIYKSEIMHRLGLPEALSVFFFFFLDLNVFREERARRKTRSVLSRAFDFVWCTVV